MNVVIFAGPSIQPADIEAVLPGAVCRPPAAQGDVYRAALSRPSVIGLVDGYFERVPAVWHKELLWALSQGIHVFGSASMGALRAAELAPFGMVGIGAIFEAFRDGVLEDDDEVAVAHGPVESGYRTGSDAMVNIRATLRRAGREGVIDEVTRSTLERLAKSLFYPERSYARVLELGRAEGVSEAGLEALRAWLPGGRVNQKREDALAMLQAIAACLASGASAPAVGFVFEETLWWQQLKRHAADGGLSATDERVLERLAVDDVAWERATTAALGWLLAGRAAEREGWRSDGAFLVVQSQVLCDRHGLTDGAAVERWLAAQHATHPDLEQMIEASAAARTVGTQVGDTLVRVLLQYLRWTGDYARLATLEVSPPAGASG